VLLHMLKGFSFFVISRCYLCFVVYGHFGFEVEEWLCMCERRCRVSGLSWAGLSGDLGVFCCWVENICFVW